MKLSLTILMWALVLLTACNSGNSNTNAGNLVVQNTNSNSSVNVPQSPPSLEIKSKQTITLANESHESSMAVISSDLKMVATARMNGKDKWIKLFDIQTGKLMSTLQGNNVMIRKIVFSPDGTLIAAGSGQLYPTESGEITIWDLKTGKIKTKISQPSIVQALSFSSDGKTIASSDTNEAKLWDVETGNLQKTLDHGKVINAIAFSTDGKSLATGSNDIKIWDLETGQTKQRFTGHTDTIHAIGFSPDGALLASGGTDKTIRVWSVDKGTNLVTQTEHTGLVHQVVFSPDSQTLASLSHDNTARIWNTQSKGSRLILPESQETALYAASFSSDGKTLTTFSRNGNVKLWDINAASAN